MSPAAQMAQGNWQYILPKLGVDSKYLRNEHGPCPICNGKDRFRWDDQNNMGGYLCSQCGAGDGFDLARKVTGMTFKAIADKIAELLGKSNDYEPRQPDPQEAKNRAAMKALWEGSRQPTDSGPVSSYLQRRVGCHWQSPFIRENMSVWAEGKTHAAMVCKIVTHTDKAINLHQTFLTLDGQKADLGTVKKVMAGKLPDGCAIRLSKAAPIMGVAEGIESAISASILHDMPVWACINGGLLSKWVPPETAEEIYVFGDNDASFTGHAKAYHLANRLEVQYKRKVKVIFPQQTGHDMNDVHRDMMFAREVSETHLRVIK